ncbi:DUF4365 domain-containing protein [Actinokineospora spheciospongiae]|uniref:DUF4365 domain-containing protein n=1 Tax=Actinokineospora spheciospongiae TaxID=909613 RepID=UPI001C63D00B|nr:DUF4365 domain-containing protein [Actinokineospora spheciospongiae]
MFDLEGTERTSAVGEPLDGGLPMTARQEQFSLAFVRMIAAASGCSIKSHETDYDGVDITIASSTEYKTWYCPEIEIQLKCTTQRDLLGDEHLAWTLKRKPFTKLTHPQAVHRGVPRRTADSPRRRTAARPDRGAPHHRQPDVLATRPPTG